MVDRSWKFVFSITIFIIVINTSTVQSHLQLEAVACPMEVSNEDVYIFVNNITDVTCSICPNQSWNCGWFGGRCVPKMWSRYCNFFNEFLCPNDNCGCCAYCGGTCQNKGICRPCCNEMEMESEENCCSGAGLGCKCCIPKLTGDTAPVASVPGDDHNDGHVRIDQNQLEIDEQKEFYETEREISPKFGRQPQQKIMSSDKLRETQNTREPQGLREPEEFNREPQGFKKFLLKNKIKNGNQKMEPNYFK